MEIPKLKWGVLAAGNDNNDNGDSAMDDGVISNFSDYRKYTCTYNSRQKYL